MSSNEEMFRAAKLTADNYHNWKFSIKMMLIGRDLWEIVEGSEVLPEEATPKQTQEFRKRVNKALSLICLSVSDNLQICAFSMRKVVKRHGTAYRTILKRKLYRGR